MSLYFYEQRNFAVHCLKQLLECGNVFVFAPDKGNVFYFVVHAVVYHKLSACHAFHFFVMENDDHSVCGKLEIGFDGVAFFHGGTKSSETVFRQTLVMQSSVRYGTVNKPSVI